MKDMSGYMYIAIAHVRKISAIVFHDFHNFLKPRKKLDDSRNFNFPGSRRSCQKIHFIAPDIKETRQNGRKKEEKILNDETEK